jgi:polyisoprenoid-binding protein YceI
MPQFSADTAECTVFTYKEGLLSPIAHDLKIAVTRFTVTVTPDGDSAFALQAEFDASSPRVRTAMRDGLEAPQLLSESDRRKIEHNIVSEVLAAASYPKIGFTGLVRRGEEAHAPLPIVGKLTLHGRTRELVTSARQVADRFVAEVTLHQPDYGIKPYSALLGTLRIRPDLTVRLALPSGDFRDAAGSA